MVPGVREATLPMGFVPSPKDLPRRQPPEADLDIEQLKVEAENEWLDIRKAFGLLESQFGPSFEPCGLEYSTPIYTPFGIALTYRNYGIAGIVCLLLAPFKVGSGSYREHC